MRPPLPEQADGGEHPQADQDHAGESRPPVLLVGIGAEQDEAMLLGDEAPAGLGLAAGLRIRGARPRRGDPVDEQRQARFPSRYSSSSVNSVLPMNQRNSAPPAHRKTILALYQFMKPEIERLMVRYTAMMMRCPRSPARSGSWWCWRSTPGRDSRSPPRASCSW